MSNQRAVINLIKKLSGQAGILAVPRVYIDLTDGDINAAIVLSQCVYWSDKGRDAEGWFYKSYAEWHDETGLTQFKVKQAANRLKPWVETQVRKARGAPTVHYRVDLPALTDWIMKKLDNQDPSLSRNSKMDYEETSPSDYEETSQSLTSITTKPQSEITEGGARPARAPDPPAEAVPWLEILGEVCVMSLDHGDRKIRAWQRRVDRMAPALSRETGAAFAAWFRAHDWRGKKNGEHPTPALVFDLWPQCFGPDGRGKDELSGYDGYLDPAESQPNQRQRRKGRHR